MTVPSFVIVLPAIDPILATTCIEAMHPTLRDRTFLVDNTESRSIARLHGRHVMFNHAPGRNTFVTKPWNDGAALARAMHCQYLVILSQSIMFGDPGGRDFVAELNARAPEWIMHSQHGWKCLAINMQVFDIVGLFDPTFPSYRNEIDLLRRMALANLPSVQYNGGEFHQIVIDATSAGDAQALVRGHVTHDFNSSTQAWFAKWGGEKLEETYTHPYDDGRLDWTYIGPPPIRTPEVIP